MTCPKCKDYLGKCPACGCVPKAVVEYPADIMHAAEEALDNLLCNCRESCGGTEGLRLASIKDIAKTIMAERERRDASVSRSLEIILSRCLVHERLAGELKVMLGNARSVEAARVSE